MPTKTISSYQSYDYVSKTWNKNQVQTSYKYERRQDLDSLRVITSTNGRQRENDCVHETFGGHIVPWRDKWKFADGGGGETFGCRVTNMEPNFGFTVNPPFASATNALLDDVWGAFPASTSLPVNIAEAASLKTLVPGLLKGFRTLAKVGIGRKSWKELAGSHLAYSFGLKPLLTDLHDFMHIGKRIRSKKAWINANAFQQRKLHGSATSSGSTTSSVTGANAYYDFPLDREIEWKCKATVSALVTQVPYDDYSANVRLIVGALGLNNPIGVVWDMTPLSFVGDWFIPVGETLLANPLIQNPRSIGSAVKSATIHKGCHSTKLDWREILSCTPTYNGGGTKRLNSHPSEWSAVYDHTRYTRSVGFPPESWSVSTPSGWSLGKSALSFSLLSQKLNKSVR